MEPFAKLSSELAHWYWRRLKYIWVTALTQGLGFFVLYAVLVVAGVLLARESFALRSDDERRLDEFLRSEHEVRDEDQFVSALSVVLSAVDSTNRIKTNSCPAGSVECLRARLTLTLTTKLAQALEEGQFTPTGWHERVGLLLRETQVRSDDAKDILLILDRAVEKRRESSQESDWAPDNESPPATSQAPAGPSGPTSTARVGGSTLHSPATAASVDSACHRSGFTSDLAEHAREVRQAFGLVRAYCEWDLEGRTAVLIPEQVAHVPRRLDQAARARMEHAIYVSSALEAALRAVWPSRPAGSADAAASCSAAPSAEVTQQRPCVYSETDGDLYTFVAAYFIGVDSIMRYWHLEPGTPLEGLPTNRLWAASEYFAHFLQPQHWKDSEFVSRPYLDFAGAGVVQTICQRVDTRSSQRTTIAGIVCVDLALRQRALAGLVAHIQGGPFFSAGLLQIDPSGAATMLSQPNQGSPAELQALIHSLDWRTTFTREFVGGEASRSASRVGEGENTWYIVPIGRVVKAQLAVALRPALSSGVGRLGRWAILGGLWGSALVLLTFTAHQSRRLSFAERDLARLRGLAAAVIECRPDPRCPDDYMSQFIIAGNDRAEEVLQTRLPNFGLTGRPQPRLRTLFEESAFVEVDADGVKPTRRLDPKVIEPGRRRDDTSGYYVRLAQEKRVYIIPPARGYSGGEGDAQPKLASYRWIRIAASAVVLPRWWGGRRDARGRMESTIGIVVPVWDEALSKELDSIAREELGKQGSSAHAGQSS